MFRKTQLIDPTWLEDRALLNAAGQGDSQAVSKIVSELAKPAFNMAYQILLSREDAEDCVQDSFYRLWKSIAQFKAQSSLKTYFLKIVIRACYAALKKRNTLSMDDLQESEDGLWPGQPMQGTQKESIHTQSIQMDQALSAQEIQAALAQLVAKQRMALVLWAYHDCTASEIGELMEMNKNSVDQLILRGKRQLKKILEKDGHGS